MQRDNISQRYQLIIRRAHIVFPQVLRVHAEWLVCLDVHAIGPVVEIKVIYILRTHVHAERRCNLADRHTDGLGFLPVNLHQLLRIVRREAGEQSRQVLSLPAFGHNLVGHGIQVGKSVATLVLKHKLKSAEAANSIDGRRLKGDHNRSRNAKELWSYAGHNVTGCVSFALAFVNRLEWGKNKAGIRRASATQRESGNGEGTEDIRISAQNLLRLFRDVSGIGQRSALRRLYHDDEIVLVFLRHETGGNTLIHEPGGDQRQDEKNDHHVTDPERLA